MDLHEDLAKGHFGINTTIKKILASCYWWPAFYKDIIEMYQTCDICQWLGPIWWNGKTPLKQVMAFEPFIKWSLNFMGLIKLAAIYTCNPYIVGTTNYTNKWIEVKTLRNNTTQNIGMNTLLLILDAQFI